MTSGKVAAAALALSLLAGCAVRERTTVADPHRAWWTEHHPRDSYDRGVAEREHRDYCRHTPDRSCEGWH
jgi:hypothetical protein